MMMLLLWLSLLLFQANTYIHMASNSHKFYRRPDISQGKSPNRFCLLFFLFCRLIQCYFANAAQNEYMSFDIRFSCTFTCSWRFYLAFILSKFAYVSVKIYFRFCGIRYIYFFLCCFAFVLLCRLFPPYFTRSHCLTLPSCLGVFVCVWCLFFLSSILQQQ